MDFDLGEPQDSYKTLMRLSAPPPMAQTMKTEGPLPKEMEEIITLQKDAIQKEQEHLTRPHLQQIEILEKKTAPAFQRLYQSVRDFADYFQEIRKLEPDIRIHASADCAEFSLAQRSLFTPAKAMLSIQNLACQDCKVSSAFWKASGQRLADTSFFQKMKERTLERESTYIPHKKSADTGLAPSEMIQISVHGDSAGSKAQDPGAKPLPAEVQDKASALAGLAGRLDALDLATLKPSGFLSVNAPHIKHHSNPCLLSPPRLLSPWHSLSDPPLTLTINANRALSITPELTLDDICSLINNGCKDVVASYLKAQDNKMQFFIQAKESGQILHVGGNGAQVLGLPLEPASIREVSAIFHWNGIEVIRSSNHVTDLVPGVNITLKETASRPINVMLDWKLDTVFEKLQKILELSRTISAAKENFRQTRQQQALSSALATSITMFLTRLSSYRVSLDYKLICLQNFGLAMKALSNENAFSLNKTVFDQAIAKDLSEFSFLWEGGQTASLSKWKLRYKLDDVNPGLLNNGFCIRVLYNDQKNAAEVFWSSAQTSAEQACNTANMFAGPVGTVFEGIEILAPAELNEITTIKFCIYEGLWNHMTRHASMLLDERQGVLALAKKDIEQQIKIHQSRIDQINETARRKLETVQKQTSKLTPSIQKLQKYQQFARITQQLMQPPRKDT